MHSLRNITIHTKGRARNTKRCWMRKSEMNARKNKMKTETNKKYLGIKKETQSPLFFSFGFKF